MLRTVLPPRALGGFVLSRQAVRTGEHALPPPRRAANLRGMKLPRKGILIRLGIYLPIIGVLAWQAFFANDKPAPAPQEAPKKKFQVMEVSPEEAKAMGWEMPEDPPEPAAEPSDAAPKDPQ